MLSPAAGPEALLSLLLLAREHAVEPAVAACLQLLLRQVRWVERRCSRFSQHILCMAMKQCLCCSHVALVCSTICTQASQLPAIVCLTLLHELDTGCSAHDSVQAAAHQLASLSYYSMFTTLRAPATIADREVQAALLRYLGPLHDMLNDHHRRQLFMSLSFETVRVSAAKRCNACTAISAALAAQAAALQCVWLAGGRALTLAFSPSAGCHFGQCGCRHGGHG